ncbi:MAG: metallopeptidase family protein [Spirochaetes bacterium]|jgi:predicted Zn-dependent protease with MMP-like domain|nr:metallopeptidase family protein [Spirochaetota bacterium]
MRITRHKFETLVDGILKEIISSLPPDLRDEADRVVFETADRPTSDQDREGDLLGLFSGTSLPEKHIDAVSLEPDRITVFRIPLMEYCRNEKELAREIRITLVHELGHYFGFEEDRLEEMGLS